MNRTIRGTSLLAAILLLSATSPCLAQQKAAPLSLSVSMDKKVYQPQDKIVLSFRVKNDSDKDIFIGDGYLGPKYTETGPNRHFELHVTAEGTAPLHFWSGMMTEGQTAGIRKVFKLKPGEAYTGSICLSAGMDKDKKVSNLPHDDRGGSFEDKKTKKAHVLGKDGKKYTAQLLYQVRDQTHGVWMPPKDFKEELLWKGQILSKPIEFEVKSAD